MPGEISYPQYSHLEGRTFPADWLGPFMYCSGCQAKTDREPGPHMPGCPQLEEFPEPPGANWVDQLPTPTESGYAPRTDYPKTRGNIGYDDDVTIDIGDAVFVEQVGNRRVCVTCPGATKHGERRWRLGFGLGLFFGGAGGTVWGMGGMKVMEFVLMIEFLIVWFTIDAWRDR